MTKNFIIQHYPIWFGVVQCIVLSFDQVGCSLRNGHHHAALLHSPHKCRIIKILLFSILTKGQSWLGACPHNFTVREVYTESGEIKFLLSFSCAAQPWQDNSIAVTGSLLLLWLSALPFQAWLTPSALSALGWLSFNPASGQRFRGRATSPKIQEDHKKRQDKYWLWISISALLRTAI